LEGRGGGDRVDEDKALAVLHVQVTHGGELFLRKRRRKKKKTRFKHEDGNQNGYEYSAGSIENLEHALLTVDLNLFSVRVLDGGVVLFDEDGLDKLDGL